MHNFNWYVVNTNPRCEDIVHAYLSGDAFEVFLPKIYEHKSKGIKKLVPLFPGYLFVRLDINSPTWAKVKYTPGVRKILGYGDNPAPINESVIEEISCKVQKSIKTRVSLPFKAGDSVVFTRGPFEGCEGLFTGAIAGKERVKILLRSIYMSYTIEAKVSDLKAN